MNCKYEYYLGFEKKRKEQDNTCSLEVAEGLRTVLVQFYYTRKLTIGH